MCICEGLHKLERIHDAFWRNKKDHPLEERMEVCLLLRTLMMKYMEELGL